MARRKKAATNKRGIGPISVLTPEDLLSYSTLYERVEAMVENRCDVFIHNVEFLLERNNLSQAKLCDQKLEGMISSPALTGYKNRGKDIPLKVMVQVASAFGLTVEEMCGQLLDEKASLPEETEYTVGRPVEEYKKYIGTYDLAYFDSSKPIGENDVPTANSLNNAILTIYASYNAIGTASFRVVAIFNCTDEERKKAAGLMADLDLSNGGDEVRNRYESVVAFPDTAASVSSRMKCLYEGDIHLTEQMAEITLHQVRGNDVAHLFFHNRAATSSDGKAYKGGLGTMMSVSRGEEHMPCVQAVLMLKELDSERREGQVQGIPRSRFDFFSKEFIARKIYMKPPKIDLGQEIEDIITYMKFLFMQNGDQTAITKLSDEDKAFCLEAFAEKKLTEPLQRNILSYYKVAMQMDTDIYDMTRIR